MAGRLAVVDLGKGSPGPRFKSYKLRFFSRPALLLNVALEKIKAATKSVLPKWPKRCFVFCENRFGQCYKTIFVGILAVGNSEKN